MPSYKKQHFVPKFLLKNFSSDKKSIQMYALSQEKLVQQAGIKEQCYRDYFYGKNLELETGFNIFEAAAAPVFLKIINNPRVTLTRQDIFCIYEFIHIQGARTTRSVENYTKSIEQISNKIDETGAELNPEDLQAQESLLKNPWPMILGGAIDTLDLVHDLQIKILINQTNADFLISDHPVSKYNQWAEQHSFFKNFPVGNSGLICKGLCIFLPISPRVQLALCDSEVYRWKGGRVEHVQITSEKDVIALNLIQVINAHECVYFSDFNKLGKHPYNYKITRTKKLPRTRPSSKTHKLLKPDGTVGEILITDMGDIKIDAKFTFLKNIDHVDYTGYRIGMLPPRSSPEIIKYLKEDRKKERKGFEVNKKKETHSSDNS